MSSNGNSENYIFFLKFSGDIDDSFIRLATMFADLNIKLVPVTLMDLMELTSKKKEQVIIVRKSLRDNKLLAQYRSLYLDMALLAGRFTLFDYSSFPMMEGANKFFRQKSYFHNPLPIALQELVRISALQYYRDRDQDRKWPGGRRATLSNLVATKEQNQ